jgi:hypothetical protein
MPVIVWLNEAAVRPTGDRILWSSLGSGTSKGTILCAGQAPRVFEC